MYWFFKYELNWKLIFYEINFLIKERQSFGIKETTEFLDLADEMIQSTQRAKEDGKVDWKDIPNFMGVPVKMLIVFNGIEKINDELTDLGATEIAELERRIDAYSKNPRYANLVGHLMAAANELVAIIKENKANEN